MDNLRSAPARLQRLQSLARLLDVSFRVPGTRWRFGWDALLGLIPGLGDGAGAVLSAWFIVEAARLGAPRATLLRMAGNVAVEAVVGAVPLLGDLFDAAYKANLRNLRLLERHLDEPEQTERASRRWVLGLALGIVALVVGVAGVAAWLVVSLLGALLG